MEEWSYYVFINVCAHLCDVCVLSVQCHLVNSSTESTFTCLQSVAVCLILTHPHTHSQNLTWRLVFYLLHALTHTHAHAHSHISREMWQQASTLFWGEKTFSSFYSVVDSLLFSLMLHHFVLKCPLSLQYLRKTDRRRMEFCNLTGCGTCVSSMRW